MSDGPGYDYDAEQGVTWMNERDVDKDPYSEAERRIADYISEATSGTVGAGDDPVGFLLASHALLRANYKTLERQLEIMNRFMDKVGPAVVELKADAAALEKEIRDARG